jgi:hypothetical protein
MTHKDWLDNEYEQWIKALQESTVHNFKNHPMVKRMLGEIPRELFAPLVGLGIHDHITLGIIDNIGKTERSSVLPGTALRMIYYAKKVLAMKPSSIIEIGGGVGEFCAILYALGYEGAYNIADLLEVKEFQYKYLAEVTRQTGLRIDCDWNPTPPTPDLCLSFYALGEFDDKTKEFYIDNVVKRCKSGLILWNPHSGATKEVPFACTIAPEYPLTAPDNLQLTW